MPSHDVAADTTLLTISHVRVLNTLLADGETWAWGKDLAQRAGVQSSTAYPLLRDCTTAGRVEAHREPENDRDPTKPPRTLYRLTPAGRRWAIRSVEATTLGGAARRGDLPTSVPPIRPRATSSAPTPPTG